MEVIMKKPKNNISKVTVKKKQSGGVVALDQSRGLSSHKVLPKIYISLSNKYIDYQVLFSRNTITHIKGIINKSDNDPVTRNRLNTLLMNRKAISLHSQDEKGDIYFSQWMKGPPHFMPSGSDYNIEEESTSLFLTTFKIEFGNGIPSIKQKENGVIVNVHTVARILQRLGYSANHVEIRKQIDQAIFWYDSIYQLALNGEASSFSGISIKTESGVISGTYVLLKNEISQEYTPVFLARTFISTDIMNQNQFFVYKYTDFEKDNKENEAKELLHLGEIKDEAEGIYDIKKIIELKNVFYSNDNLYERIDASDKNAIVDEITKDDIVNSLHL
jgi:hypothetical protein